VISCWTLFLINFINQSYYYLLITWLASDYPKRSWANHLAFLSSAVKIENEVNPKKLPVSDVLRLVNLSILSFNKSDRYIILFLPNLYLCLNCSSEKFIKNGLYFYFYSDRYHAGKHVPAIGPIILIPSQPVFALGPYYCVFSEEAVQINFAVFGLTLVWPYRSSNLCDMFCSLWFDPYRSSNLYDLFCSLWFDPTVARIYTIFFAVFGLTLPWLESIRYVLPSLVWPLPWLESIRYVLQSLVWPYRSSNLCDMLCGLWFDLTVARIYTICFAVFGLTLP
jgi:hypothetical protein